MTNETLEKFRGLLEELEDMDETERVMSLYSAKDLESTEDGSEVVEILPDLPASEAETAQLKQRIRDNNLIYEQLVSKGFQKMALIVQLKEASEIDDARLRERVNAMIEKYRGPEEIYVSGLPITRSQIQVNMQQDLKRFLPFAILLMIILLAFSFRSWMGFFYSLLKSFFAADCVGPDRLRLEDPRCGG